MISASHNPFRRQRPQGLRPRDGTKLSDALERRIEAPHARPRPRRPRRLDGAGRAEDTALVGRYVAFLETVLADGPLRRPAPRCSTAPTAPPAAIAPAGLRPATAPRSPCSACAPDGRNINLDCGSLHLEALAAHVRERRLRPGARLRRRRRPRAWPWIARAAPSTATTSCTSRRAACAGRAGCAADAVVATMMSNLWLEQRLAAEGIAPAPRARGRQVRARADARRGRRAGRRAVGPRDLPRAGDDRRRDPDRAAAARRAARRGPAARTTSSTGSRPARRCCSTCACARSPICATHPRDRPRRRRRPSGALAGRGRVRAALLGHRAAGARDGRGARAAEGCGGTRSAWRGDRASELGRLSACGSLRGRPATPSRPRRRRRARTLVLLDDGRARSCAPSARLRDRASWPAASRRPSSPPASRSSPGSTCRSSCRRRRAARAAGREALVRRRLGFGCPPGGRRRAPPSAAALAGERADGGARRRRASPASPTPIATARRSGLAEIHPGLVPEGAAVAGLAARRRRRCRAREELFRALRGPRPTRRASGRRPAGPSGRPPRPRRCARWARPRASTCGPARDALDAARPATEVGHAAALLDGRR